ncbi:MAG: hypothetical protein PHC92_09135 [Syntrophomonadaceae bacterium]|nr:hypothetical protein [Syntrophomonadaceae bacterium]MDD3024236.1 hypothetical protein [Syntrophomonadaceae bacterium]
MKNAGKTKDSIKPVDDNKTINPIDDPQDGIDFFMPLPDDVYKKWIQK